MVKLDVALHYQRQDFLVTATFTLPAGLTVLFGPSGCGKSTLLHLLAGLLYPQAGTIRLGDTLFCDVHHQINLAPQQRKIGYVFQEIFLFPHLNVRQNMLFALDKLPRSQQQARLKELSELLQLDYLLERYPRQLSGGQAQRVALARAIAYEPQLLLLDEPFNALDSAVREQLGQELKLLVERLQIPAILVTHQREEALRLADKVMLMESGLIQKVGEPMALLGNKPHFI